MPGNPVHQQTLSRKDEQELRAEPLTLKAIPLFACKCPVLEIFIVLFHCSFEVLKLQKKALHYQANGRAFRTLGQGLLQFFQEAALVLPKGPQTWQTEFMDACVN